MTTPFPFSAIVGQAELKTALLLSLIDPKLGGVLISGPRGSAKSTIVRSLSQISQGRELVTLPLGATDEMVTGSLKLDAALKEGEVKFAPGLLAKVHNGLLYVDEVNLLPDHLVDLLLDVAASGQHIIERDGISHTHPADFVLIGTMNPSEGELRPQLLDRFGLMATVENQFSLTERQQIVTERLAFDEDPEAYAAAHAKNLNALKNTLTTATQNLNQVTVSDTILKQISERCFDANVEGLRADITLHRATRAHAALQGKTTADEKDLDAVTELVLAHRRNPNQTPPKPPHNTPSSGNNNNSNNENNTNNNGGSSIQGSWGALSPEAVATGELRAIPKTESTPQRTSQKAAATTANNKQSGAHQSHHYGNQKNTHPSKPHWFKTLSDIENTFTYRKNGKRKTLHLRYLIKKSQQLDLILLDTSASTLNNQGLTNAKGVITALSQNAYLKRHRLTLITFGNDQIKMVLSPQRAPKNIEPHLQTIQGGGGTPLDKAIHFASNLLNRDHTTQPNTHLYLITDGRVNNPATSAIHTTLEHFNQITLIDIETSRIKLGIAKTLAIRLGANYHHIETLPHHHRA